MSYQHHVEFPKNGTKIASSEKKHRLDLIRINKNFYYGNPKNYSSIIIQLIQKAFFIKSQIYSLRAITASTHKVRDFKLLSLSESMPASDIQIFLQFEQ